MERKLKNLFDYQRFEADERLAVLIADTESRYETELSDDDLELVSAAGEFVTPPRIQTDDGHDQR